MMTIKHNDTLPLWDLTCLILIFQQYLRPAISNQLPTLHEGKLTPFHLKVLFEMILNTNNIFFPFTMTVPL